MGRGSVATDGHAPLYIIDNMYVIDLRLILKKKINDGSKKKINDNKNIDFKKKTTCIFYKIYNFYK